MLEDQFDAEATSSISGLAVGVVEEVTFRITRVRICPAVWYVRNGEILRVGNRSQGWTMAVVDVPIGYTEDP
ncbi:MAG: hypothetical protein U0S36_13840 [Candidatus Nanopelagicales bacterium]